MYFIKKLNMHVFDNSQQLQAHLKSISNNNWSVGFVPTMGALHEGHLSLLKESMLHNKSTVISIFVNPTQFNNPEDLLKYPRTLATDIEKIKTVSNEIIVFSPTAEQIYAGQPYTNHYDYDGLENEMEGQFRPGHFDGVGTVVKLLFDIVQPTNAYFGEKDFQQLQIIKKLAAKLRLKTNIIACPIYREKNGLAMSSRNARLTLEEKNNAAIIYQTLQIARNMFINDLTPVKKIIDLVIKTFKNYPNFMLEYFEIANEKTLKTCLRKSKNNNFRAFIAVYVNNIRLIDTISLK